MDRYTCRRHTTVILLKTVFNTIQSINYVPFAILFTDVINLSSQLTSMELSKRKAKKRVRFELPETDIRPASSQDFVSFQKDTQKKQKKAKQVTIYKGSISTLVTDALTVREKGTSGSFTCDQLEVDKNLLEHFHPNDGDDNNQITPAKRSKSSETNTFNDNNNCSNTNKQYLRRKKLLERRDLNRVKKGKGTVGLDKKLLKHKQVILTKTVKEIKAHYKGYCRKIKPYSLSAKKANYTNVHKSVSKEKQTPTVKRKGQQKRTSSVTSKYRRQQRIKSRRDVKRAKLDDKMRRKATMAKSLKNKVLKRKLAIEKRRKEQAIKRMARKKAAMKKKLAEKRKRLQRLKGTKKLAVNHKIRKLKKPKFIPVKHKIRKLKKPKFIPIEREEEVSNSMRINLLIYRTFLKAADNHSHCCPRRCWKDWEELDVEDVYFDFE